MDTKELIKKVRKIEIKTKGLSSQVFSGEYHSAFKGRGMAFAEVREYMPGDEIRTIDWNVTARFNTPYVKVFQEERELTMMLLVDISGSSVFGTKNQLKRELIAELCAVLSFSAAQNNDKIGVILFSDQVELFIPPKKGKKHILRIIRELLEFESKSQKTDLALVLRHFNNAIKKKTIAFVISDFIGTSNLEESLKIVNKRHDVIALQVNDPFEEELPKLGLINVRDAETGETQWINTSSKKARTKWKAEAIARNKKLSNAFRKSGVDFVKIETNRPYIIPLMNLFKRR
ncbi:MAG: DUF58 domain-containing protein [Flavobacteriales bacterium]|nr:DUF58 domain-containing protein [Flavobacteriales bacterium]